MYAVVIYQHPLHLEICLLAILLILKLDERILETVTSTLVANDFARHYSTETAEYGVQVIICGRLAVSTGPVEIVDLEV